MHETPEKVDQAKETDAQMFRRLQRVLNHVSRLGPAERDWLMMRLAECECSETRVGIIWTRFLGRRAS